MQFKVKYPDGTEKTEEASDCTTVEQFINSRFGSSSGRKLATVVAVGVEAEKVPSATKKAVK